MSSMKSTDAQIIDLAQALSKNRCHVEDLQAAVSTLVRSMIEIDKRIDALERLRSAQDSSEETKTNG